jgi:proteic killer suppression protein
MVLSMDVVVELTKQAKKDLAKVPGYIAEKARLWIEEVREDGLEKAQANPKWGDEAKRGKLHALRAIWLNREYRLFYEVTRSGTILVTVLEVNHHDYKKVERRYR